MTRVKPILVVVIAVFVLLSGCSSIADMNERGTPTSSPTPIKETDTSMPQTTTNTTEITTQSSTTTTLDQTPTETSTATTTQESTPTVDYSFGKNITIKASGGGYSKYVAIVKGDVGPLDKADDASEAVNPDTISYEGPEVGNRIVGYIENGGVDAYTTEGELTGISNKGNATLEVYIDGVMVNTVGPGSSTSGYNQEETTSTTEDKSKTLRVQAAGGGTSNYVVHGVGDASLGSGTEKSDSVSENEVKGITGEGAKDSYTISNSAIGQVENKGTATLEIYIDDELVRTVQSDKKPTQAETESSELTEVSTSIETTASTPTETDTPTETKTETETTVNTKSMQKVEVQSIERESVSYEFVSSGDLILSSESDSDAQVDSRKGIGTVSNYETHTYYIPKGEKIIEARNLNGLEAIRITVGGEPIDVSGGPDIDKSNFNSNSTITIKSTSSKQTTYDFFVTGDPFPTSESDTSNAVYPDTIDSGSVTGTVGDGGTDEYKYTGSMKSFLNGNGPVEIYIDGELVATVESGGMLEEDDFNSSG